MCSLDFITFLASPTMAFCGILMAMQKYIGGLLAIAVVLGFFFFADGSRLSRPGNSASSTGLNFPLVPDTLSFPTLDGTPVGMAAWDVWQRYLAAAEAHDLETIKALSYQLSETCADPNKKIECEGLMDSAHFFGSGFKQSDFKNVIYDEKQIVLATDYVMFEEVDTPIKTVLYFVREEVGPKILGMRFCAGEEGENDECVETSLEKRDQDRDGWWDDVEELFK